MTRSNWKDLCW